MARTSTKQADDLEALSEDDESACIHEGMDCIKAALRHLKSAQRLLAKAGHLCTEAGCTDDTLALQEPFKQATLTTTALDRAMVSIGMGS